MVIVGPSLVERLVAVFAVSVCMDPTVLHCLAGKFLANASHAASASAGS